MGSVEKLETKFRNGNAHFWNHWRASASPSNGIMETYPRDLDPIIVMHFNLVYSIRVYLLWDSH
jgi:hypothetical protein